GADDYLVKPFSARELLARIAARLEVAQMRADIIKQERLYAQRQQQQAQELIQARNEFISMISHDLKNPLGAIKGYSQLLQRLLRRTELEPSIAERMASSLTGIDATVLRITMLVNELLDLAQLQVGKPIQLTYQSVDLLAIIRQVITEQQQTSRTHKLRLDTTLEELRGSVDVVRLGRVIANLISNAIKYSPKESEIVIKVAQEAGPEPYCPWAIIAVQDNGIGIPAQDLPHIFEQFRRGENVLGKIPGTGLGLASVQHIIERHGGIVTVISKEGAGSIFTIRLPLQANG
ncbi:MAG TPA: hybrid sensor histidine kinase/response regulator, partial [Ktedonobacteraceae bacterium]|nr:hybrid sensor histidine kinase/response regulator [Ktedonobacteraceae bacterium]